MVLVRHWLAAGSPGWQGRPLGSFESWCHIVGAILDSAGIAGFLENRGELYRQVDQESEEWRAFVEAWWTAHQEPPRQGRRAGLHSSGTTTSSPACSPLARAPSNDRAMSLRLGKALSARRDRAYGAIFIRKPGTDAHQKTGLYSLEKAAPDHQLPASPAHLPQQKAGDHRFNAGGAGDAGIVSSSRAQDADGRPW